MKQDFNFYKELFKICIECKDNAVIENENSIKIFDVSFDITKKDESTISTLNTFKSNVFYYLYNFDVEVQKNEPDKNKVKDYYNYLVELLGENNDTWKSYLKIMSVGLLGEYENG